MVIVDLRRRLASGTGPGRRRLEPAEDGRFVVAVDPAMFFRHGQEGLDIAEGLPGDVLFLKVGERRGRAVAKIDRHHSTIAPSSRTAATVLRTDLPVVM